MSAHRIVVKENGDSRLYFPVAPAILSKVTLVTLHIRPFLSEWSEEGLKHLRQRRAEMPQEYGRMPLPEEVGPIGEQILRALADLEQIDEVAITPVYVKVDIRPGYDWPDLQLQVVDIISFSLGWKEVEIQDYFTWYRSLSGVKEEVDPAEMLHRFRNDSTNESELPSVDGIVVQEQSYGGPVLITYWPPFQILSLDKAWSFKHGNFRGKAKKAYKKLSKNGKTFVDRILTLDGVMELRVSSFYVTVSISPAFDRMAVHREVLTLIQEMEGETVIRRTEDTEFGTTNPYGLSLTSLEYAEGFFSEAIDRARQFDYDLNKILADYPPVQQEYLHTNYGDRLERLRERLLELKEEEA